MFDVSFTLKIYSGATQKILIKLCVENILKNNEIKTNFTMSYPKLAVKRWQNLETLDKNSKKFLN